MKTTEDYSILSKYLETQGHVAIATPPTDLNLQALMVECHIPHVNGYLFGTYMDGMIMTGVVESNNEYVVIETWCAVEPSTVKHSTTLEDSKGVPLFLGQTVTVIDENNDKLEAVVEKHQSQYVLRYSRCTELVDLDQVKLIDSNLFPRVDN